jgi:hypothetical protein
VTGRALLGIAGAYFLRALTEMGTISPAVGVAAGFLYAAAWLYLAARSAAGQRFTAGLNTLTSAGILGPLLWEASLRFQAINSWTAAAIIAAYALTAVVLCWNRPGSPVPVIATAGSSLFAVVLLVAARDLLPFTLALLAIAAGVEFAACFDREASSRPFLAFALDMAVVICTWVAGRPGGPPPEYVRVPALAIVASQIALMTIYLGSTAARTLVRHRAFTLFEMVQTAAAFAIGLGGAFQMARTGGAGTAVIGVFAVLGAAACYVVSFLFVGRDGQRGRNFHTYATFALLLFIAGTWLLYSGAMVMLIWAVYAVACCWAGMRAERHVLELHAAVTLALALFVSGFAVQPFRQFFGDSSGTVPLASGALLIAASALSYAAIVRGTILRESTWDDTAAAAICAVALSWTTGGLAARFLAGLWPQVAATTSTMVLTALAASLAWAASRWRRPELRMLVYAFMAVAAYKLIVKDLRQEQTLALVPSLLFYGATLMLLPRVLRQRARTG